MPKSLQSIQVTPGNLTIRNSNLRDCIQWAYRVRSFQVDGPDWLNTDKYDILAKAANLASEDEMRLMLQELLAEKFKLTLRPGERSVAVYGLVVGKGGTKLHASKAEESSVRPAPPGLRFVFQKEPVSQLAETLSTLVFFDRPVIDMTGLSGQYDFSLDLTEVAKAFRQPPPGFRADGDGTAGDSGAGPSVFTAIQEQLGLKLENRKSPIEVLVVEHAERVPDGN